MPSTKTKHSPKKAKVSGKVKGLSWVLAILIVIFLGFTLLFWSLSTTAFSDNFYKKSFSQADFYNRMVQDGVPSIILETDTENDNLMDTLMRQGIVFIFQKLVTPDWLQQETEGVIDKTFSYLKSKDTTQESQIKDFLGQFNQETVSDIDNQVTVILNSIPTCEQVMLPTLFPGINCEEMNNTLNQIKTEIKTGQEELQDITPELLATNARIQQDIDYLIEFKNFFKNVPLYFGLALILLGLVTLALAFLRHKNVPSMLKWLSVPYFIVSVLLLLKVEILKYLVIKYIGNLQIDTTVEMKSILIDVMNTTVVNLFLPLQKVGWLILILSVLLFIVAIILDRIDIKKAFDVVEKKFEKIEKKVTKKRKK